MINHSNNATRVDEVGEYSAISVRTLYHLIDEGELKRTKIRGCLRIPVWEIERYEKELEKQLIEPCYPAIGNGPEAVGGHVLVHQVQKAFHVHGGKAWAFVGIGAGPIEP